MKKRENRFVLFLLFLSFLCTVQVKGEKEGGIPNLPSPVRYLSLNGEPSLFIRERLFMHGELAEGWIPFQGFIPVEWTVKNEGDESRKLSVYVEESLNSMLGVKVPSSLETWHGNKLVQTFKDKGDSVRKISQRFASFVDKREMEIPARTERSFLFYIPLNELQSGVMGKRKWEYYIKDEKTGKILVSRVLTEGGVVGWSFCVGAVKSLYHPEVVKKLGSSEFNLFLCDPEQLPADERYYSSLDAFLMDMEDWERMSADHCRALLEWVSSGGLLFVSGYQEGKVLELGNYGMGRIFQCMDSEGKNSMRLIYMLVRSGITSAMRQDVHFRALNYGEGDYVLTPDKGMTAYILVFLLLAGPVNFVFFAPRGRRMRLLWTFPLTVVAAIAGFVIYLMCANGISGEGRRFALVQICPDFDSAHIFQSQISRSGFLWDGSFAVDDDIFIKGAFIVAPDKRRRMRAGLTLPGMDEVKWNKIINVRREKGTVNGLFGSYKILYHQGVKRVFWQSGVFLEGHEDESPVVSSNLPVELTRLEYRDDQGRKWGTPLLVPGEKKRLQLIPEGKNRGQMANLGGSDNNRKQWALDSGCFQAEASSCPGVLIPTLPSIRWQDRIVFRGKVHSK